MYIITHACQNGFTYVQAVLYARRHILIAITAYLGNMWRRRKAAATILKRVHLPVRRYRTLQHIHSTREPSCDSCGVLLCMWIAIDLFLCTFSSYYIIYHMCRLFVFLHGHLYIWVPSALWDGVSPNTTTHQPHIIREHFYQTGNSRNAIVTCRFRWWMQQEGSPGRQ